MLTEARCKAAMPKTRPDGSLRPNLIHDGSGLYLQCSSGAGDSVNKSWLYRYSIAGKGRQIGLGAYPTVSLAEARKAADAQRGIRAEDRDPKLVKDATRAELEAKILAEQAPKRETKTFDQCATAYIAAHRAGWKNRKSESSWRGTLQTYAGPVIGGMDVAGVTRMMRDLSELARRRQEMLEPPRARGVIALRAVAVLRQTRQARSLSPRWLTRSGALRGHTGARLRSPSGAH
jgi:Arm DNA-binding domain